MPLQEDGIAIGSTLICLENRRRYILSVGNEWLMFVSPEQVDADAFNAKLDLKANKSTTINGKDLSQNRVLYAKDIVLSTGGGLLDGETTEEVLLDHEEHKADLVDGKIPASQLPDEVDGGTWV